MPYVDGFVAAVPNANKEKYREHAAAVLPSFLKHGAVRCVECWGDDVPKGEVTDFRRSVQAKDDETVIFAWIEWPDKATRDRGMAALMPEMEAMMRDNPMPFDGKRMIYGGFESLLDERQG
ncbi:DUF1428 domain-containing protein [Aureimonas leprariae]|uniref:DUF1428 domain-containing protein n=1 Tax=Plantimonas leprariae TaxID=2615207 RepID=A0A7V7PRN5_9HYPH|nr:DUF1428 domain-containing protein [Aureimonas leprariae]KAB0681468.1 DUF1428 domain-containing protein [Aureimonas leprariae]